MTDPTDDQVVEAGALVTTPPAFENVDLLTVSAVQPDPAAVDLFITTKAEVTATQNVTLAFVVQPGPLSLPASTASGQAYSVLYHDGVLSGIPGATANVTGKELHVLLPLSAIGAVGGDVLANVTATSFDTDPGSAPGPVTQDNSNATDIAPDQGASATFTLQRPPRAGSLALDVLGGTVQESGASPRTFAENTTEARNQTATVAFRVQVTNQGLDADTVALSATPAPGTRVSLSPSTLALLPGAAGESTLTVTLEAEGNGTFNVTVTATSMHGGQARTTVSVVLAIPEGPAEPRKPVPEALGFLTPLVTSVGLDEVFGRFAELAFLLFVLLLVVVVVFLLLFMVKTPWVRVRVTPRKVVVAPGGVAEFHVEMEGRKSRPTLARATLRTLGTWTAGLQMGRDAARSGESMDVPLESGRDALPQEGVLRVQVPYDAPAKDKQDLEFDVVPVDSDGASHPKHAARAKVTVEAAPPATGKYASARDIRLAEVKHDPAAPRPGATVRTTATVHNDGPAIAKLRVVLQKDGKGVSEERIDVPPHDARTVTLAWTAGVGRNMVKVQIFLA